jgi:zinc finger SWIM domain-containing protein 3
MLEIMRVAVTDPWVVDKFVDNHEHPLANPEEVVFLRSHRRITDAKKAEAIEYGIGGLRTCEIMDVMVTESGGFDKVGFARRDLYNFFARYKKKRIVGRDAEFVLNHMKAQEERDAEFFFRHTTDEEGHLRNLFWADSQSQIDYEAFGDVVVFDSTYRVNRYNLPFVPFIGLNHHRSTVVFGVGIISDETVSSYEWLLHMFLEAMSHKHPKSVITDGDSAMRKAIKKVLTMTDHRLCSWHIEQNMIRHLRNPMLENFRKLIYMRMGSYEFEKKWAQFQVTYITKTTKKKKASMKKRKAWMKRMYKLRKMWAAAYTKGRYFLGMQSNQRSESLNSRIHTHLDWKITMVDLVEHSEHFMSRRTRPNWMQSVLSQSLLLEWMLTH